MKKSLLLLVCCLGLMAGKAYNLVQVQSIYFHHAYTSNYSSDTVSLVLKDVGLAVMGYPADTSIYFQNDSGVVKVCYWLTGSAQQPYLSTDTFQLGIFSAGIYQVKLYLSVATSFVYDA